MIRCSSVSETEEDPAGSAALWSVISDQVSAGASGPHPCLLLSANISVVFVHPGESLKNMSEDVRRLHYKKTVPHTARSSGVCGDTQTEVSLSWSDHDDDDDVNLINLVISRNFRLADLTGVFARIHLQTK